MKSINKQGGKVRSRNRENYGALHPFTLIPAEAYYFYGFKLVWDFSSLIFTY